MTVDTASSVKHKRAVWFAWGAVIVTIVAGGVSYDLVTQRLVRLSTKRIILPVPLSEMPLQSGDWKGEDSPLSPEVEKVAANDDYINRFYINAANSEAGNLYVAYSGRPRTMVGHRPQVCYVNAGWIHDFSEKVDLPVPGGGTLPCLVHKFHQPPPKTGEVFVLNYYILNGVTTNDEDSFAGVSWRLPNINGNPAWYVTQVQVSSRSQATAKTLAVTTVETILDFLPDKDGKVKAEGKYGASTGGSP